MLRKSLALGLAGLIISISLPALAHAQLVDANPKANQVLISSPSQFRLNFSDQLVVLGEGSNWLKVEDSKGLVVSAPAAVLGSELVAQALGTLKAGSYRLSYRVLSEDGHPVEGSYRFTVAQTGLKFISSSHNAKAITLNFSQVLAKSTKVTVIGPNSKPVTGSLNFTQRGVIFSFKAKPAAGRYVVHYLAETAAGETLRGSLRLSYR